PEPAPARIRSGPSKWVTASCWAQVRSLSRSNGEPCDIVRSLGSVSVYLGWSPGFSRKSGPHRLKPGLQRGPLPELRLLRCFREVARPRRIGDDGREGLYLPAGAERSSEGARRGRHRARDRDRGVRPGAGHDRGARRAVPEPGLHAGGDSLVLVAEELDGAF